MNYYDGSPAKLGDIVVVRLADRDAKARIVLLGDTEECLDVEAEFIEWSRAEGLLRPSYVLIEWVDPNPFAHDDPRFSPVGNFMFTELDSCVVRVNA